MHVCSQLVQGNQSQPLLDVATLTVMRAFTERVTAARRGTPSRHGRPHLLAASG